MDLLEYQGKLLLARHGIPMQSGRAVTTVDDAVAAADVAGYPVVVKAQVRAGGRGKAGGIKLADDEAAVRQHAAAILGMVIKGATVRELWVGGALPIAEEYYASVVFDRRAKAPLVMLSRHGGVEIETLAVEDPDALATLHVDPLLGFQAFHGRRLAFEAGIPGDLVGPVGDFLARLYATFVGEEASLVEVNPLVVTPGEVGVAGGRELVALDAKVTLDDNALFRHPENAALRDTTDDDPQERMARARGLTYVKLDGNIGILGNGAGLVMSTLDVVALHGGAAANFLDAGGGSKAAAIAAAVEVILSNERVTAVLFNIFGGITRCDEVARGLIEAFAAVKPAVPFVVRLDGTNGAEGRALLDAAALPNMHTAETMDEAAELVVRLARSAAAGDESADVGESGVVDAG
jgi:succinyl-CoA synthetase beta subunit